MCNSIMKHISLWPQITTFEQGTEVVPHQDGGGGGFLRKTGAAPGHSGAALLTPCILTH